MQTIQSRRNVLAPPTFSPTGTEEEATLIMGQSDDPLWFPEELAVLVEPGWGPTKSNRKGIFLRREPGGPVLQWLEPKERYVEIVDGVQLHEVLYKHWQTEKLKGGLCSGICLGIRY